MVWWWHSKTSSGASTSSSLPRSIYIQPDARHATAVLALLRHLQPMPKAIAALAVGGADHALSDVLRDVPELNELVRSDVFQHVYYEGLDHPFMRIRPLPEGLAANYICHTTRQIRDACTPAHLCAEEQVPPPHTLTPPPPHCRFRCDRSNAAKERAAPRGMGLLLPHRTTRSPLGGAHSSGSRSSVSKMRRGCTTAWCRVSATGQS